MVKVYDDKACVLHGHPQKPGSPTDKPEGTPIHCYSFAQYGKEKAIKKAQAMHYAIAISQKRRDRLDAFYGHRGRPGLIGGSVPRGQGGWRDSYHD